MKPILYFLSLVLLCATIQTSCNTSKKVKGGIIGAVVGGAAGALISDKNKAAAIILGAGVGGAAGALIGNYMDDQAEEIADDLEDAQVERVGEGIVIIFDSGLLFDFDSYQLRQETKENLNGLVSTLEKYDETNVNILGHTDSVGTNQYNQQLSRQRANAVETYLESEGISSQRLNTEGYGETDPIVTNETEEGRQQNRRVEIVIVASEDLKEAAREGKDISPSSSD